MVAAPICERCGRAFSQGRGDGWFHSLCDLPPPGGLIVRVLACIESGRAPPPDWPDVMLEVLLAYCTYRDEALEWRRRADLASRDAMPDPEVGKAERVGDQQQEGDRRDGVDRLLEERVDRQGGGEPDQHPGDRDHNQQLDEGHGAKPTARCEGCALGWWFDGLSHRNPENLDEAMTCARARGEIRR